MWTKKSKAFVILLLLHPQKCQFSAAALCKWSFPLHTGLIAECLVVWMRTTWFPTLFRRETAPVAIWIYHINLLPYLQVSDVINNSPALNGESLRRDVVIVDLEAENTALYKLLFDTPPSKNSSAPHPLPVLLSSQWVQTQLCHI